MATPNNQKKLSQPALSVIDQYLHFQVGNAVCSVPYFNNKTVRARAALRATIGKGSPKDIQDELQPHIVKQHIDVNSLSDASLKKLLADSDLGIECSGFAYYVLSAESAARGLGTLDKHIRFVKAGGILGKIRSALRPVENCNVETLADSANSTVITLRDVRPGDIITMLGDTEESERDHILVIHQVESDDSGTTVIRYSHAVAYPEDGLYGTGIKQGTIEIGGSATSITDGVWSESGSVESAGRIFMRAQKSKTELRRLNCL